MSPLISFIVLSYNYEKYIEQTLRSILNQTVQDFEIIVVDDCSKDNSVEIINAINDSRIRLIQNHRNIGGAASYNVAVVAARGKWLVNLDADDWILPNKIEEQLNYVKKNPESEIIGTYVSFVDKDGFPHQNSLNLEQLVNNLHDFQKVDTWIGANYLCRSSTMVLRSAHLRIGLDDDSMVRAPDYELWTRAVKNGLRFSTVPIKLTFMRLHDKGVTHADPLGTLLELSFAMAKNIIPLAESRSLFRSIPKILDWIRDHGAFAQLLPNERYRLLAILFEPFDFESYDQFYRLLKSTNTRPELNLIGRRLYAVMGTCSGQYSKISKLTADISKIEEARDFWHENSKSWVNLYSKLESDLIQIQEGRDYWYGESKKWTEHYRSLQNDLKEIEKAKGFWYDNCKRWEFEAKKDKN